MEDYKFLFKVVLVGNAGVGKTCLVRRFTQGLFPPGQGATIGVDFMIKTVEVDNEKVKVNTIFNRDYILFLTFLIVLVANMGHGRTRKVSFNNTKLLQICTRFNISI